MKLYNLFAGTVVAPSALFTRLATRLAILIATVAATLPAAAIPMINGPPSVFTENYGPNTSGFPLGHHFQIAAFVEDPLGVPGNINSVQATAQTPGQPDYSLPFQDVGSIFMGLYNIVVPYTGQVGRWEVEVQNSQAEVATALSTDLNNPLVIPIATGLQVNPFGTDFVVTWDPVLFDDDMDAGSPSVEVDNYIIRLLNSSFDQFFRSAAFTGNSFVIPGSLLNPGVTVARLEARDLDGGNLENRSSTFATFDVLAVPEPTTIVLLALGLFGAGYARRRRVH